MSLNTIKNFLVANYNYSDVVSFFRTTAERTNPLYCKLLTIHSPVVIMQARANFRRSTNIDRNIFIREIGRYSKRVNICYRDLSTEVELAFHLATIFNIVGEDEFHLETNDLVGVDPTHEALDVLLRVIQKKGVQPYRKMLDFYDRAEFFFLRLVPKDDDTYLGRMFYLVKNVVCLYRNHGKPYPTDKYMLEINGVNKVVPNYPSEVYIPGVEKASVDSLVRSLKILSKKLNGCHYLHGNSGLLNGYCDKSIINVYYFVEMLKKIPESAVSVVHNFNGSVAILSSILAAENLKLYFVDSVEKPKYVNSTRSFFGVYLCLYTVEIKNELHINYQVPAFRTQYTHIDAQMNEFKESQSKTKYSIFRCDRIYASSYELGYPDYSSMSTVWVTRDPKTTMAIAIKMMLGFFSMTIHYSAYLMDNKLVKMGFSPIEFSKPADIATEEETYQAYRIQMDNIAKQDEHVEPEIIPKREIKRSVRPTNDRSQFEDEVDYDSIESGDSNDSSSDELVDEEVVPPISNFLPPSRDNVDPNIKTSPVEIKPKVFEKIAPLEEKPVKGVPSVKSSGSVAELLESQTKKTRRRELLSSKSEKRIRSKPVKGKYEEYDSDDSQEDQVTSFNF